MSTYRRQSWRLAIALVLPVTLAIGLSAQEEKGADQSKREEAKQAPAYEPLAKGIVGSGPLRVQFKSAPLRLEIRNLVMGRGETEAITAPTRILLEVRQGAVTTTAKQERQSHTQGDFFAVEKGSTFTIQNSGEVAVLRAIYIFEGVR